MKHIDLSHFWHTDSIHRLIHLIYTIIISTVVWAHLNRPPSFCRVSSSWASDKHSIAFHCGEYKTSTLDPGSQEIKNKRGKQFAWSKRGPWGPTRAHPAAPVQKSSSWKSQTLESAGRATNTRFFLSFFFRRYYSLLYSRYKDILILWKTQGEERKEIENGKNTIKNYHSNRVGGAEPTDVISTKLIDSIEKCCVYKRELLSIYIFARRRSSSNNNLLCWRLSHNFTLVFFLVRIKDLLYNRLGDCWVQISALTIYITSRWRQDWHQMLPITVSCAQ